MRANLSLILDKEANVRLDLITNQELEVIDEYTASKQNHHGVRDDFRPEINLFLEKQKEYVATFKREANKKGNVVITFNDENGKIRKMRVLYQESIDKTNYPKQLGNVIATLKKLGSLSITVETMEKFQHLIFASDYDRKVVSYAKKNIVIHKNSKNEDEKLLEKSNQRLIKHIKDKFLGYQMGSENQQHVGYYYLRLLDAHIEKSYNVKTSATAIKTKVGTVRTKKEEIPQQKVAVVRENVLFHDQILKEDDDGQFSLFGDSTSNEQSDFLAYFDREEPPQR